jgi:hypothetical protein
MVIMKKGYYGHYTGNARHSHTRVTSSNYDASEKDDAAHIDYLKQDINYDAEHEGSDKQMTDDEKHISKLAGDMKYNKKKHGDGPHMGHSPMEMSYSPLTKHCTSAARYNAPMKMENVIDRDAKSSGKNQYDKYGK